MTSSQAVYPLPADINSAAEEYKAGNKQAVHRLLIVVASHYPGRIREFLWNASRAVGSLYCRHGDNAHAGLCHRSRARASAEKSPGRMQDSAASTTAAASPAFSWRKCWHGASLGLWNICLPSQTLTTWFGPIARLTPDLV